MKNIFTLALLAISSVVLGQFGGGSKKIKFSTEVTYKTENTASVTIHVKPDAGYHYYSQFTKDGGPIPASIYILNKDNFIFPGKTINSEFGFLAIAKEIGELHEEMDPQFGIVTKFYGDEGVDFVFPVKLKSGKSQTLKIEMEGQICNEFECVRVVETFDLKIDASKMKGEKSTKASTENTSKAEVESSVDLSGFEGSLKDLVTIDEDGNPVLNCNCSEGEKSENAKESESFEGVLKLKTPLLVNEEKGYTLVGIGKFAPGYYMSRNELSKLRLKVNGEGVQFERDTIELGRDSLLNTFVYKAFFTGDTVVNSAIDITGSLTALHTSNEASKVAIDFDLDLKNAVLIEGIRDYKSYWGVFWICFAGGLIALLTPCVFPMIPMTVSFFTKQSKTRAKGIKNALIYGASIIALYVMLGLGITIPFGPEAMNDFATNPYVNIGFFVVFIVFALSFLGAFEIRLPSKLVNAADRNADKGGLIGIIFMAFTLALVSFSCTGPIIGSLLVEASTQGYMGPFIGMFGFSLALSLPFMLFALFPGWLNSLPQSGGWLNSVKVVLGFVEIALAFKFLSNADLVWQSHLLERELFMAIWVACALLIVIYLMGGFRLPHDSKIEKLSVTRIMFVTLFSVLTLYLLPGVFGGPVKLFAGFPPPKYYSEYSTSGEGHFIDIDGKKVEMHKVADQVPTIKNNLEDALKYSAQEGKPLLIDFTGHACPNCRKMEDQVWLTTEVLPMLKNDFVIASLHTDEKTLLKPPVKSPYSDATYRIEGDKWKEYESVAYGKIAQPFYVIVDQSNTMVSSGGASYETHSDPKKFTEWLEKGLENYKAFKEAPIHYFGVQE